jgi:hypothetical protein
MNINSKTGTLFERIIRIPDMFMVDCFGRNKLASRAPRSVANDYLTKNTYKIQNT